MLLISFLLFFFSGFVKSQSVEYLVKASYIEKFARFTEWNNGLTSENLIIAVLGSSPFNGELEKLASTVKIKNKDVKIIYSKKYSEIKDCNLLFICSSEKNKISEILSQFENLNVLVVSDIEGSCKKGAHLSFFMDNSETIKYEVNPEALKNSNLTIEMTLLKFGKIIQ